MILLVVSKFGTAFPPSISRKSLRTVSIYAVPILHSQIVLNKKRSSTEKEMVLLSRRVIEYEIFTAQIYKPPAHVYLKLFIK